MILLDTDHLSILTNARESAHAALLGRIEAATTEVFGVPVTPKRQDRGNGTFAQGNLSLQYLQEIVMMTIEHPTGMAPAAKAELQDVCDRLASGTLTSAEQKRQALASLKKMQDEIRKRIGVQSIAVELVRQSRDRR